MVGEMVIVRDFGGKALVRKISDETGETVFVTDDKHYENDNKTPLTMGFPRYDIFKYEPRHDGDEYEWDKLIPY